MRTYAPAGLIFILAFMMAACTQRGGAPDMAHNARNSLDWAGTYRGVLPCADCPGIETIVHLSEDGRYAVQSRYLERNVAGFSGQGMFSWDEGGNIITIGGDRPAKYRVGEGQLTQLSLDGSAVIGALASHYVLAKITDGITERYWKLVELNGQPVPRLPAEPHLILKAEGGRVTGFGGCNSFAGTYTLDNATARIRFGQIVMTLRACPSGMETEKAFGAVLNTADNFTLNGDRLSLNRARMAPLARFEAVYLR